MSKRLLYTGLILLGFTYAFTIMLVKNSTSRVVRKDMQMVSGILYSANIVLLDVEQSVEKKYADILYETALKMVSNSVHEDFKDVDVAFYMENGRVKPLLGYKFVDILKNCIDSTGNIPVALVCNGFYVYMYPGKSRVAVAGISRKKVEDEKARIGLNRFFNELSRIGFFFYVALEDMDGVVYSTIDERLLRPLKEDSMLLDVYMEGGERTRMVNILGKKVLETVIPFSYSNFRGIMRVGIDATEYIAMEKRVLLETTILYIALILLLFFVYVYLNKAKKAQSYYRDITEALRRTQVPVVMERGRRLISISGGKEFENVIKNSGGGEREVFVEGRRYLLKRLDAEDAIYYLFISTEKEDMKKKLMEYEALGRLIGEVAHEIKNPLNGIYLLVQTLNMESKKEEYIDIMNQIKRIEESLNRFVALLAPLRLSLSCTRQKELIYEAVRTLGIAKDDKVKVYGDVSLKCDKNKMREVYVNLLKNALESSEEGRVDVNINPEEGSIIFRNKGRVPDDVLNRMFEPFYTTKEKGTGLGMYYVKKVIEAHGFRIGVRNLDNMVEVKIEFTEDSRC